MFSFFPREARFFDFFEQASDLIVQSAQKFDEMLKNLDHAESYGHAIKDIESKADEVTHNTVEMLHKTFITPLDRDDIYRLISKMDDIIDIIEAAAQRIVLYGIKTSTPELIDLSDVSIRSVQCLKKAIQGLNNLKNPRGMINDCVEVNRLENEADHILRFALAKLFREEPDAKHILKYKEIYELLESVTDCCEDVANIIEGIVLEYA